MLACQKCGWQDEDAKFCANCGGTMFEVLEQSPGARAELTGSEKKFIEFFMEPTEQFICALGNSFLQNYLTGGGIRNGFAAVSDKRVYFKGRCLLSEGGKYRYRQEERVVDVKDITGTGYTRVMMLGALGAAIISMLIMTVFLAGAFALLTSQMSSSRGSGGGGIFVFLLVEIIVAIAIFLSSRRNLFEIQFAGGKIAFETKWYDKSEVDDFQRQIRLAKDNATSNAEPIIQMAQMLQQSAASVPAASGSTADELKKFADLLAQGAITQKEYDEVKADLLKR